MFVYPMLPLPHYILILIHSCYSYWVLVLFLYYVSKISVSWINCLRQIISTYFGFLLRECLEFYLVNVGKESTKRIKKAIPWGRALNNSGVSVVISRDALTTPNGGNLRILMLGCVGSLRLSPQEF